MTNNDQYQDKDTGGFSRSSSKFDFVEPLPAPTQQELEEEELFKGLVENACQFVKRSVDQFHEKEHKYSIINFYTGLELFIKSRLMAEDWNLLLSKKHRGNWSKFISGDLPTPNLKALRNLLKNKAGVTIPDKVFDLFKALRMHRNKLVHFRHNAFLKEDHAEIYDIITTQGNAWYYLHKMLTRDWDEYFYPWDSNINSLNYSMCNDPVFQKERYKLIKPYLDQLEAEGTSLTKCDKCLYRTRELTDHFEVIKRGFCHVCLNVKMLGKCSKCEDLFDLDGGTGSCKSCGKSIDITALVAEFSPFDFNSPVRCGFCEFDGKSIVQINDDWMCLACGEIYGDEGIDSCYRCGARFAGRDLSGSPAFGCPVCNPNVL